MQPIVDLRSDTLTKPTEAMRRAMAAAEVGDDVYSEDPTLNRLEQRAAEVFGREAAMFVPSGSMANTIAVMTLGRRGGEVICEERAHIYSYEMASISAIGGCAARGVKTDDGILTWELVRAAIRPKGRYLAQTCMVSIENTHNVAGGVITPVKHVEEICDGARAAGLRTHLDGARIFNAAVALGKPVAEITRKFDSVTFCVSKGLGAPVGSLLMGTADYIAEARINRKILGGGMRQAGVLAAAGLIALDESPKRLHEDHENAQVLAVGLASIPGIKIDPKRVQTNIVVFDVSATGMTAQQIATQLATHNVKVHAMTPTTIRAVTHCDVDRAGCQRAVAAMEQVCAGASVPLARRVANGK
jgi:threonine aldolase